MSLKDILVYLDAGNASERRLRYAAELARAQGAHLTGLYVTEPLQLVSYFAPPITGYFDVTQLEAIESQHQQGAKQEAAKIEPKFQEACRAAGITGEWQLLEGLIDETVAYQARYKDVVVLGQSEPGDLTPLEASELPAHTLLTSGRPVLIHPHTGNFQSVGKYVLIAWDRSKEAARAVHDALPILQKAEGVTVLTVESDRDGRDRQVLGANIARHLARHDVKAQAATAVPGDHSVGDILLSRASDVGADLIVMGGYGHSRTREFILGGTTRTVLKQMKIPVLLSH